MGVDQLGFGQRFSELGAQAADVDVDRAVVGSRRPAPDLGEELLPGHDPLRMLGQRHQQLQLTDGEAERAAVDERCVLLGLDLQPSHACEHGGETGCGGYPAVKVL